MPSADKLCISIRCQSSHGINLVLLRLSALSLGLGDISLELPSWDLLLVQLIQFLIRAASGFGLVEEDVDATEH